jgi:tetratricopeptide (TPR) repeat protein
LSDRGIAAEEAGRTLGVDYVTNGAVRRRGGRIVVKVELVECASRYIVWTDEFERREDDLFDALEAVCNSIVASIAEEIESVERNRAILKPPTSLDAWDAYHRGLWHMYRFSSSHNEQAAHYLTQAVGLDPSFSRAHAALSFTHFQDAFLHRPHERALAITRAYETAGDSLLADDRDPAAHWAMGRALWLQGEEDGSLRELARSVDLSPNFALAHYTVGFVHSQSGDARGALAATGRSLQLSPFDPLQFAMLATRAISHARLGELEASVDCARKAAVRPNAHEHIVAIAAHCFAVAGEVDEARTFAHVLRQRRPGYTVEDFFTAFRFSSQDQAMFRGGAERIGLA